MIKYDLNKLKFDYHPKKNVVHESPTVEMNTVTKTLETTVIILFNANNIINKTYLYAFNACNATQYNTNKLSS